MITTYEDGVRMNNLIRHVQWRGNVGAVRRREFPSAAERAQDEADAADAAMRAAEWAREEEAEERAELERLTRKYGPWVHPIVEAAQAPPPEADDPAAAARHASTHARRIAPGCQHRFVCGCGVPHHLRCDWVRRADGARCRLGAGHYGERHVYE